MVKTPLIKQAKSGLMRGRRSLFLHDSSRVLWGGDSLIDGLIGSGHGVGFSTIDVWFGECRITSDLSTLIGSWMTCLDYPPCLTV